MGESSVPGKLLSPVVSLARTARGDSSRLVQTLFLLIMTAGGFGLRLIHLDDLPVDFHPTRQYRSALIARALYLRGAESTNPIAASAKKAAELEQTLEPPINEALVAALYCLWGGDDLRIGRVFSAACWTLGAVCLFLLAGYMTRGPARLVSVAFYLFVPFSVIGSRSFQPDSLMVMLLLAAVWAITRALFRTSPGRVVLAISLGAMAGLVKPMSLIPLAAVYLGVGMTTWGFRSFIVSARTWTGFVAALAPAFVYYAYGIVVDDSLAGQMKNSFLPQLILTRTFWSGWLHMVWVVVGYHAFLGGVLGYILVQRGLPRTLIGSWFAGYVLFALLFNYHAYTHDYYHLMLIPLVALAIAPTVDAIYAAMHGFIGPKAARVVIPAVIGIGLALSVHRGPWWTAGPNLRTFLAAAREIGELVGHSDRTIILSFGYGKPLEYHAGIAGAAWPRMEDFRAEALRGVTPQSAGERLRSMMERHPADFFIVTDIRDYERQTYLRDWLTAQYAMLEHSREYLIFDLRTGNASPK